MMPVSSYMQHMHLLCRDFWVGRRPAGYLSLADVTTLCAQSDVLSVLQPSCVVNNGDPMTNTRGNLRPYRPALPCVDPLKYVHRVGRAGRYGRKAFVLTLLHGNL